MGRRQRKKVFCGILFLLGALALLLGKLGYLEGMGFWTVFFSIILLGILAAGILKRSFGEILFPLAGLVIINDELLHLEAITPWPVLGAALLGTIGLNFIFPGKRKWKFRNHFSGGIFKNREDSAEPLSGEELFFETNFGDAIKYVTGQISRVFLETSFGRLGVYFNDAVLKENKAKVSVDCSFGDMELFIPSNWNVIMDVSNSFGNVGEDGHGDPNGVNTLIVEGEVSFGNLVVHYI